MSDSMNDNDFYTEGSLAQTPLDSNFEFLTGNADAPMPQDAEGIEILVHMAKTGKIDPWNIDIVDIAEKYLAHVLTMKANNLKMTGRTLLFLAILLKLKSDVLEGIDIVDFEDRQEENFEEFSDDDYYDDLNYDYNALPTNNVISLNEVLERRRSTKLNRNRVVTLQDLIKQLEFYEQMDKKLTLRNKLERAKRRVRSYSRLTPDDIVNLAHSEYIKASVDILHENLKKIFESEDKVSIETLTLLGLDKISVYIGLLFLSAESDYELVQDEFYSDVFVVKDTIKTDLGDNAEISNETKEIAVK